MSYEFQKIEHSDKTQSPPSKGGYCNITKGVEINNRYKIDKFVGEGAYSQVWRALDNKSKNLVVLKIYKGNKKDNESGVNEYKILEKLDHINIVKVYDNFLYKTTTGKHIVMVMEYLGDTLSTCKHHFRGDYNKDKENIETDTSCFPIDVIRRIMGQILNAVKYLHNDKKIIHTDLKLENILLTKQLKNIKSLEDFNIKIVDFGTSHMINGKLNYTIGTFEYNSPEIILGFPYNTLTDIWSCGCIFLEMISGYCLFDYSYYYQNNNGSNNNSNNSSISTLYSERSDDDDIYHIENLLLSIMIKVLGNMPIKLFKRGKYFEIYFTNKGLLKYEPTFLNENTLYRILRDDYNINLNDANLFNEVALLMLNNNPDKRLSAKNILKHKFFN